MIDYKQAKAILEKAYPEEDFYAVRLYGNFYVFSARGKNDKPDPRTGLYWVENYTIDANTGKEVQFSVYGLTEEQEKAFDESEFIEF